jgi:limonene-1,2-epoxide hydrolase
MTPHEAVLAYVDAYNGPTSWIYPLYADEISWVESPFGRNGGREVLFAACREAREKIRDCHLDIVSIHVGEDSAVLESVWSGYDRATGAALPHTPVIWVFGYDADGKIVTQRDYSVVKGSMPGEH